ncbi:MAG: outer membrane protein transport protein [Polyangiales bacterium]
MKLRFRRQSTTAALALLVLATGLALPVQRARANSEPPSVHGARYTGTGGLGAAFVEGPPSVFHNPAGLLSIDKFELTLGFTTLLVTYNAPFGGYGSEQDSPPLIGPLPFLGAGFRVADDWVVGLSLYISVGFGGNFTNIGLLTEGARVTRDTEGNLVSTDGTQDPFVTDPPVDQSVQLFIAELAIPVAWEPIEGLRLAAALRLPYGNFKAVAFQDIVGTWAPAEQTVAGFGIPGVFLGVQYDVSDVVTIGAAYRSQVRVHMSGRVDLPNGLGSIGGRRAASLAAETDWYVPHMIRAGVAFHLLERRLMLSVEGRVQMHARANRDLTFALTNDHEGLEDGVDPAAWRLAERTGLNAFRSNFEWKNVYLLGATAEYNIADNFRWRFAATWGNNATPATTVTPFSPPPSTRSWQVATGFGVDIGTHLVLDVGFAAGLGPTAVIRTDDPDNCANDAIVKGGCNGNYSINSWFMGLSATYRL